ncbi:putative phosphoesterase [Ralstonia phage RpY2]|uniref:Phosphoesterase n=1 Tax=Ralstonia phage RpY2 TaxID=2880950 RepID=A0AC61TNF9_9CAUD|nr:putative phosphoesterase [Ralstonia phage RpY2]
MRYALEGTPYATAVEVKAVSIDAAYEAAEEMYPNWEIEAVIQVG